MHAKSMIIDIFFYADILYIYIQLAYVSGVARGIKKILNKFRGLKKFIFEKKIVFFCLCYPPDTHGFPQIFHLL